MVQFIIDNAVKELSNKLPHLSVKTTNDSTEYVIIPIVEDCVVARFNGKSFPNNKCLGLTTEDAKIVYEVIENIIKHDSLPHLSIFSGLRNNNGPQEIL